MTATEYNKLSDEQRSVLLIENGMFIEDRIDDGKYKIVMYGLFNFYVEALYHIEKNKIETIQALANIDDWERYLQSINLDLLY